MTTTWPTWLEIEPTIRDRAYRRIEDDPQFLLETDTYPHPDIQDADLIYARLIGYEEEIVRDGMRLTKAETDILMPIPQRMTIWDPTEIAPGVHKLDGVEIWMPPEDYLIKTARYTLQSSFATLFVSGEYRPPVQKLRDDFTAKIAYVRYRRRA